VARIIQFLNYFLREKSMDPVHSSWTTVALVHDGLWIGVGDDLAKARPNSCFEHGCSPVMAQRRERSTGSPSQDSPRRERWCGDRVTVVRKWWRKCSVRVALGRGEKRRRTGRGAVEDDKAGEALTWAREAVRQPSDDGKATVVEVALELEVGRRRVGTGAAKVG
jgi:hypothetical protein